ncbi:MAG TPA: hypothetical protein VGG56_07270 [Terracidiphilus sp.]
MKFAGLLAMPAGFFLSIAALVLFPASNATSRGAFVLCGLAVEALGLVVAVRGHMEVQTRATQAMESGNIETQPAETERRRPS